MANTFKSNVASSILTTGNTVYTVPAATTATVIGLSLANKSGSTITANAFITRSSVNYALIANVSIVSGSTILVGGGDQKIVLQAADSINVSTSAATSMDVIISVLEIT